MTLWDAGTKALMADGLWETAMKTVAAGICHSDLSVVDGFRPVPMVLGHEAAGIVREVGPGVQDFRPDDPVVFSFVPTGGRCVPRAKTATGRT